MAGKTQKRPSKKKPAAMTAAVSVNDKDETGWRKLTGNSNRNLSPLKQERMYEIAVHLWENTPLGKWIIEIIKDFLVADGLPFQADNDDVSEALEDFFYDPLNQLDVFLEKHAREQWLFGVLLLPAFTGKNTGSLRVGYLDPAQIDKVITDPGNTKMIIGVILKAEEGQKPRQLKIVLPPLAEEILSPAAQSLRESYADGECFYSAVNNLTNSPLGRSELLVSADWIDAHEQFLFDFADRWVQLNTFVWDITVTGGDTKACNEQANNLSKKSGSIYSHNENVTLEAKAPDLKTYQANDGNKMFVNHIMGGHGFPTFWFGSGEGEQGRALGVEMGTPTFKRLASKQRAWKSFWELVFQTVIDRRRAAGTLTCTDEDAKAWTIVLPELTTKDLTKNSTALSQVATALGTAISQKLVDKETARDVFIFILGSVGIEVDAQKVTKRLEQEAKDAELQDYRTEPKPRIPAPEDKVPPEPEPVKAARKKKVR